MNLSVSSRERSPAASPQPYNKPREKRDPSAVRLVLATLAASTFLCGCQSIVKRRAPNAPATLAPTFTPETVGARAPLDAALLQRPNTDYRLGPGDVLEIEIVGDLTSRTRTVMATPTITARRATRRLPR